MIYSVYDLQSGLFTGQRLGGPSYEWVYAHTPAGCGAWPGEHDPRKARVDFEAKDVVPYQPPPAPPPSAELVASEVRGERDAKLAATDWSQGRDVPEALALKWQPYRQQLRDITAQPGFPFDLEWPAPPA